MRIADEITGFNDREYRETEAPSADSEKCPIPPGACVPVRIRTGRVTNERELKIERDKLNARRKIILARFTPTQSQVADATT